MRRGSLLTILREFKKDYAEKYGILEIGVFGSMARDEAREDSDVDIFIKTKTPNPFILVHIKEDIERLTGKHVDIVRLREKMNPFLRERIEQEGHYV
ncbi:MAG: nucleotidyltransferase domain-containing protein [Planctomycetes bacterium]|nr:nucleotidyltransferase domain-containing protein [Planctomycetota bacterium]